MTARNPESVDFGPFRFVQGDGLWRGEEHVPLPPRAYAVLSLLIRNAGVVVSKQELMDSVWPGTFVTESSLLEAIGVIRDALGDDRKRPAYVQTVHRRGYRFIGRIEEAPIPFFSGPQWRPIVAASAAYVVTTIAVAIVFAAFGQRPLERRTSRFSIALPAGAALDPLRGAIAVSADGSRMVYVALSRARSQLFLRTVDRDEPIAISGSEDASDPFFSPDGEWIGFFAHGSIKKTRVHDPTPVVVCAARAGAGAVWGRDGTIVFGGGPGNGLARVSASGGEPVAIALPAVGSRHVRFGWPDLLPDDRGIIYTAVTLAGSDVAVFDLRSGLHTAIAGQAAFGRYSPTGHVIFERAGRLEAARFSLSSLTTLAAPSPIVSGVASSSLLEGAPFAFSRTGALVYVPGGTFRDAPLQWLDPKGQLEQLPLPPPRDASVDLAPDRTRLAMTLDEATGPQVWLGDPARGELRRLVDDGHSVSPAWRPNGLEIAFAYSKVGPFNLFMKPVDGAAASFPLLTSPYNQLPTSWTPDASRLAFTEFQPLTGADIWIVDLRTRQRHAVVRTLFDETWARFSPDGRWLAYMSNESGRWEIYVRAVESGTDRVRVSAGGGVWPCWSRDGKMLYFSAGGRTMASAIHTEPVLAASRVSVVPGADAMVLAGAVTDGDRLLVRQAGGASDGSAELRVVLEWFSELARLVQPS